MSSLANNALLAVSGAVLFGGSFIGFALMSGQPAHEIAVLKKFVKPPPPTSKAAEPEHAPVNVEDELPHVDAAAPDGHAAAEAAANERGAAINASVLGAFVLPAPFSAAELDSLQKDLRNKLTDAKQREQVIEERERELAERENTVQSRFAELQELRNVLDKRERELTAREQEADRGDTARAEKETRSWKELGKLFEEGDADDIAQKLAEFDPKDAAKVLIELDGERAAALLNALPAAKYKSYLDAYRKSVK
jgi:flagellar motility protein MotE (MotC chaperone)